MRAKDSTQLSIRVETKERLDQYRIANKNKILLKLRKKRRLVSNDEVIAYLLGLTR